MITVIEPGGRNDVNNCSPMRAAGLRLADASGRLHNLPVATISGSLQLNEGRKRNPRRTLVNVMNTACAAAPST